MSANWTDGGASVQWGMGPYTPPQSQLDAGEYQLIAYATDDLNLVGSARVTFTLKADSTPTDTQKPVVTISALTNGQTLFVSSLVAGRIRGSDSDNVGVVSVAVKLFRNRGGVNQIWNGTSFTTTSTAVAADVSGIGPSIDWSLSSKVPPQSALDAGEYQLIVYAADAAGNVSAAKSSFTLTVSGGGT